MAHINILPNRLGIFSLQEAAQVWNNSTDTAIINLFQEGCNYITDTNSTSNNNCSDACQRSSVVWADPNTIHNCMAYSRVSELLDSGYLTNSGRQHALNLGYLPKSQVNSTLVRNPIELCMIDYCEKTWPDWNAKEQNGSCAGFFSHGVDANYTWDTRLHRDFLDQACAMIQVGPNMDVGGVGVYIGYLTQLSILVYCWLHGRFMTNWIKFCTIACYTPFQGYECAKERAEKVQERLDNSHQSAALISGLSEFQRSQSWFTLTMQGTAIGALASDGSMFDADSLQEMHLTVDLLGDVAATGIICLTFGLYMLHAANKKSWYTTCLSVLALLISCVTWTMTRMTLDNLHHMRPTEHDLPACGGRSPATYCLKKDSHRFTYFEATSMGICLLAMTLMIIRQSDCLNHLPSIGIPRQTSTAAPNTDMELNSSIRKTPRRSTLLSTETKAERAIAQVAKYSLKLELAEFVMAGLTLTMFVRLLTNGELSALNSSVSWTFGQLIAVTIWIPSILEYLYAALLGISLAERKQVKNILPGMEEGSYVG